MVVSTGVSMYLTKEANAATLRQLAALAPGSTVAMTFLLPLELIDERDRPGMQMAENGARASGTPFISFFTPAEMLQTGPRGRLHGRQSRVGHARSTAATSRAGATGCGCRPARISSSRPSSVES